jgi:nitroreductase
MEMMEPVERGARAHGQILDLLAKRRSPLAFSPRRVDAEKLRTLFEAARWAPSSYNEQPWSFLLATQDEPAEYQCMLNCLVEGNRQWAKRAPVLMLAVAKLHFAANGGLNRHAFYDVGQAVAHLSVQATALDLYLHQMGGFDVEKAREVLSIPEGYQPVAMMALGYLGDRDSLPEPLRQRDQAPRTRKALEESVFTGRWGQASTLVAGEARHRGVDDQGDQVP